MEKSLHVVIRIPKSGSSSLIHMVREAFPDARFYKLPHSDFGDWGVTALDKVRFVRQQKRTLLANFGTFSLEKALQSIDDSSRDGDVVGGGHFSLKTLRSMKSDLKFITLIRDPAKRLLSEYNYSRNQYKKRISMNRIDTSFSKKMASKHDINTYVSIMLEHKRNIGNIACQLLDVKSSEDIRNRLSHLYHFGVLENMAGFIEGLREKSGRELTAIANNVTPNRAADSIDADTRRKIEELNDLDFELYEQARAMCSGTRTTAAPYVSENV